MDLHGRLGPATRDMLPRCRSQSRRGGSHVNLLFGLLCRSARIVRRCRPRKKWWRISSQPKLGVGKFSGKFRARELWRRRKWASWACRGDFADRGRGRNNNPGECCRHPWASSRGRTSRGGEATRPADPRPFGGRLASRPRRIAGRSPVAALPSSCPRGGCVHRTKTISGAGVFLAEVTTQLTGKG